MPTSLHIMYGVNWRTCTKIPTRMPRAYQNMYTSTETSQTRYTCHYNWSLVLGLLPPTSDNINCIKSLNNYFCITPTMSKRPPLHINYIEFGHDNHFWTTRTNHARIEHPLYNNWLPKHNFLHTSTSWPKECSFNFTNLIPTSLHVVYVENWRTCTKILVSLARANQNMYTSIGTSKTCYPCHYKWPVPFGLWRPTLTRSIISNHLTITSTSPPPTSKRSPLLKMVVAPSRHVFHEAICVNYICFKNVLGIV